MAIRYQGRIDHTEDSIHLLFKTQYYAYHLGTVLFCALAGLALAAIGLLADLPILAQGLLLLTGCLLFIGRDFPAMMRAEDTIDTRKSALPAAACTFFAGHAELEEGGLKKKLRYESFDRLLEDKQYLYLFLGPQSLVMIDRASIQPDGDKALMDFVTQRTGKQWETRVSLLSINLRDLVRLMRSGKKQSVGKRPC